MSEPSTKPTTPATHASSRTALYASTCDIAKRWGVTDRMVLYYIEHGKLPARMKRWQKKMRRTYRVAWVDVLEVEQQPDFPYTDVIEA